MILKFVCSYNNETEEWTALIYRPRAADLAGTGLENLFAAIRSFPEEPIEIGYTEITQDEHGNWKSGPPKRATL